MVVVDGVVVLVRGMDEVVEATTVVEVVVVVTIIGTSVINRRS